MKRIILGMAILGSGAMASACIGEAQLVAKIAKVEKASLISCKAYIDAASISFYSESMVCPLDLEEVIAEGVEVGFKDGHDCRLESGEELSGIIVKNSSGSLTVE